MRKDRRCAAIWLVWTSLLMMAGGTMAQEIQGELDWPEEWVVYAPFVRADPLPGGDWLQDLPEAIALPATDERDALTVTGQSLQVEPGMPRDLVDLFATKRPHNVAYVYQELVSPSEQVVTIGMGGDWWLEAWLNGEEVLSTLESGNASGAPSVLDQVVDVRLREGRNLLVVRLITGLASAKLAIGGPRELRAEKQRIAAEDLNVLPARFEDRLRFPVDEQALIMARRGLQLPATSADLSTGALVGLQPLPTRQLYFSPRRGYTQDTEARRFDDPVTVRLSKCVYPWEDRHLDVLAWTTPAESDVTPEGQLEVRLELSDGSLLARHQVDELSPSGLFFSVGFPPALEGHDGRLQLIWRQGGEEVGRASAAFSVLPRNEAPRFGRIPIRILNGPGATLANAPMTIGVPFPPGALVREEQVRLVDEAGDELPLQTRVTAKWSRFGSVKWLLCDFTVDLNGQPREVYLEYGPEVRLGVSPTLTVGETVNGFPGLDTGRLRVSEAGLELALADGEAWQTVLGPETLQGAFVHRAEGKIFWMPADSEAAIEELGSEKAVIRRTGWYADPATGERFCQFVTRFIFHRDSSIVRLHHTWIYTGDDKQDRIADMGWRFSTAEPLADGAVLTAFEDGEWLSTESLVQFDYRSFQLPASGEEREGRTPGVLSGVVGGARLAFGVKDFWQNFPSELELRSDGFTFYNWPRRNPPARFERPVGPRDAFRHRFAHEGEVLDFRLPDEYTTGEIWRESSEREGHWAEGRPETANAQGIARTEEMFLYLADASVSAVESARVMQGLNDESIRAVVDPAWVCASGTFGDIHPQDREAFPEVERLYDLTVKAPPRWMERLGFYGMWLHGDYAAWHLNLPGQWVSNYRTIRKAHHAFPYRWIPYVRSGDPELFKLAENAARQMVDANFCHYATAEVDRAVGPEHFRRQGWWDRSLLPWASRSGPFLRSYTIDSDYLWNAHYLTGYGRVLDVALLFSELTKYDHGKVGRSRTGNAVLRSYLNIYKATFDPWFLNAFLEVGDLHDYLYGREEVDQLMPEHPRNVTGFDHWRAADQELYAFTGCEPHRLLARNSAVSYANPRMMVHRAGADRGGGVQYSRHAAYAWKLTKDPFYLRRCAAILDYLKIHSYEGEIEWALGAPPGGFGSEPLRLGRGVPMAMAVLKQLDTQPDPLHDVIWLIAQPQPLGDAPAEFEAGFPDVYVRHDAGESLELLFDSRGQSFRKQQLRYDLSDRSGETIATGQAELPARFTHPMDPGVYRLQTRVDLKAGTLFFPLTRPGVPEVMHFVSSPEGTEVQAPGLGYWFLVPEGVESFWIEFTVKPAPRAHVNRLSVWNPEGQRVWDHSYSGDPPGRVEIAVPEGQAGQLWRATGGNFVLDPQIPPYFSLSRSKWFEPEP